MNHVEKKGFPYTNVYYETVFSQGQTKRISGLNPSITLLTKAHKTRKIK